MLQISSQLLVNRSSCSPCSCPFYSWWIRCWSNSLVCSIPPSFSSNFLLPSLLSNLLACLCFFFSFSFALEVTLSMTNFEILNPSVFLGRVCVSWLRMWDNVFQMSSELLAIRSNRCPCCCLLDDNVVQELIYSFWFSRQQLWRWTFMISLWTPLPILFSQNSSYPHKHKCYLADLGFFLMSERDEVKCNHLEIEFKVLSFLRFEIPVVGARV